MESPSLHRSHQLSLPGLPARDSAPSLPAPRLARATGYRLARRQTGRQAARLLEHLRVHGALTDHALAAGLGIALASVNSLRGALVKRNLVHAVDVQPGPFGALRTRWGLR